MFRTGGSAIQRPHDLCPLQDPGGTIYLYIPLLSYGPLFRMKQKGFNYQLTRRISQTASSWLPPTPRSWRSSRKLCRLPSNRLGILGMDRKSDWILPDILNPRWLQLRIKFVCILIFFLRNPKICRHPVISGRNLTNFFFMFSDLFWGLMIRN